MPSVPSPTDAQPRSAAALESALAQRLADRTAVIGVVGLGYVGLPLLLEFHHAGFPVLGLDIDPKKIEHLQAGQSYISYIPNERIAPLNHEGRFRASADMAAAKDADVLILCVPTPLTKQREPDMRFIEATGTAIARTLRPGQLVILESTTYPGTTEEVLVPLLEQGSGLSATRDFFVGYSPEREDPNNSQYNTRTIPKVVAGLTPEAARVVKALYDSFVVQTVAVSSCKAAEAAKLVENIFRCVNIAMVNELKLVFERMGIDIWEVIQAASTKPFGYMPFWPGPGLGGHCIPIDPFYLTWKAREVEMPTRFIELAGEINSHMPHHVVARVMEALNQEGKALSRSRVLLLGLAYKAEVNDTRESPSLRLWELLEERGAQVVYHDPHVPEVPPTREYGSLAGRRAVGLEEAANCDVAVIVTAHKDVDYHRLGQIASLIVDARNAMSRVAGAQARVVKA